MKVWVLFLGTGGVYPLNHKGGVPGYTSEELAKSKAEIVMEYNADYVNHRNGLHVKCVEAEESVLEAFKIYPKDD